ncbi:Uncharacterised protein [Escherichia coli]|nr:hypothetical protein [Escherichia coli]RJF16628.1 hypothetical protein D2185_08500 [Escherichia coli]SQS28500.1 Uncharacterised protein [Escherichia coli]SQS89199.1 Uncharacterised protein [Escherichia coli]SQW19003.1 Uncharacterised protein [Escherichia coli]
MVKNYFFLWNYNKFPFVYSIMDKKGFNTLIINVQDSADIKKQLVKLIELEKINEVKIVHNNIFEYIYNLCYRIFYYPFKKKKEKINFYLDGFVGYYPFVLANLGVPENVFFYEEGESIYQKNVLFNKDRSTDVKSIINGLVKKTLNVKWNSIQDISVFYVRDKQRLKRTLEEQIGNNFKFDIVEIDVFQCLADLSKKEKEIIKDIFFNEIQNDLFDSKNKKAIVLTQPTYLYNIHTKKHLAQLFNENIDLLKKENYDIYLKLHPNEQDDIYMVDGVKRIKGKFPFELLAIFNIKFDVGLTYNSTAINSQLIKEKIMLINKSQT